MANVAVCKNIFYKLLSCMIFIFPAICEMTEAPLYSESEFVSYIPDSPHFIMFYAPWCNHCLRMTQLWNKLASHLISNNSPITVAKVDCTLNTPLCAQEDIKAYPTLRFFNDGNKATYRGSRDVIEFVRFTNKELKNGEKTNTNEVPMELKTYTFEKELRHGLKLINFYVPWCPHCQKLAPTWKQLAEEYSNSADIRILKVNCEVEKLTCKKYGITAYPKMLAFYEGVQVERYTKDRTLQGLKSFVEELIVKYAVEKEQTERDTIVDRSHDHAEQTQDEQIKIIEAPDATDDEVIRLTGDTFDMAVQSGKAFVYFYAPWCKYCKEFAPVWNELAKKVIERGIMVKVAKVDCTKEEELCQELDISSYPTIILYKSRQKFHPFKGSRKLEELLKFMKSFEHDEL